MYRINDVNTSDARKFKIWKIFSTKKLKVRESCDFYEKKDKSWQFFGYQDTLSLSGLGLVIMIPFAHTSTAY